MTEIKKNHESTVIEFNNIRLDLLKEKNTHLDKYNKKSLKKLSLYSLIACISTAFLYLGDSDLFSYSIPIILFLFGLVFSIAERLDGPNNESISMEMFNRLSNCTFSSWDAQYDLKNDISFNIQGLPLLTYSRALSAIDTELVYLHTNNSPLVKNINKFLENKRAFNA